jgi:hypothetical protein
LEPSIYVVAVLRPVFVPKQSVTLEAGRELPGGLPKCTGEYRNAAQRRGEMIADDFDERTIANMEVALERICERDQARFGNHDARKFVAAKLIECAASGKRTLGEFTQVARSAAAELYRNTAKPSGDHREARQRHCATGMGVKITPRSRKSSQRVNGHELSCHTGYHPVCFPAGSLPDQ